jgi:hypothetical protein
MQVDRPLQGDFYVLHKAAYMFTSEIASYTKRCEEMHKVFGTSGVEPVMQILDPVTGMPMQGRLAKPDERALPVQAVRFSFSPCFAYGATFTPSLGRLTPIGNVWGPCFRVSLNTLSEKETGGDAAYEVVITVCPRRYALIAARDLAESKVTLLFKECCVNSTLGKEMGETFSEYTQEVVDTLLSMGREHLGAECDAELLPMMRMRIVQEKGTIEKVCHAVEEKKKWVRRGRSVAKEGGAGDLLWKVAESLLELEVKEKSKLPRPAPVGVRGGASPGQVRAGIARAAALEPAVKQEDEYDVYHACELLAKSESLLAWQGKKVRTSGGKAQAGAAAKAENDAEWTSWASGVAAGGGKSGKKDRKKKK